MRRTILFVAAGLLLNLAPKATAGGEIRKSPEEVQSLPKAGTFSGRVLTEKGEPISGAVVTLPGLAGSMLGKTKTSEDGSFSLTVEDLDTRPIHRFHQGLEIWAEDFGFGFVPGRRITLFPGRDKPLGDIVVEPGRTYTGRVVDHQGRPIRGASVQCGTYGRVGLIGKNLKAQTDVDGRFQTPLLPAGSHYARAEAPGYLSLLVLGETFQSAASDGALPDLILKPDHPVTGVVKNEKGEPVPDVPVRSNAFTTKTDLEGKFVLRGFSQKAMFQLQIQVDGYVPIDWAVWRTSKGFEHFEVKQTPPLPFMDKSMTWPRYKQALEEITVTSPKLEVRLDPVAAIRGIAVDTETGKPVQVTRILRCFFTRKKNGEVVLSGCRNSSFIQPKPGTFSLTYSYPTEYHLTVSAEGYEDAEAFTPNVSTLEDIDGIQVKMKKKKTESRELASFQQRVAGTVKNGGELLKFARVALWLPPRKFNAINSHTMRGRTTAGDGKVIASTILRDGKFSLDVPFQDDNWYLLVETPARIVALEGPLKIEQGKTKQLELRTQASGKVRGQVSHVSDAKGPLWAVLFSRTGIQYETRVGTDGRFEFQNVYPGNYGLKAACESVRDSEIPPLPNPTDDEFTFEKSYKAHEVPSRPFHRATRITVEAGQTTDGISIRFQP